MAYVYICDKCKIGDHNNCEIERDVLSKEMIDEGYCGGGHCICRHDRIYESTDDVWKSIKDDKSSISI